MTSRILVRSLAANAGFSAPTGIVLSFGAVPVSGWLGVSTWLTVVIGVGLLAFALLAARTARQPEPSQVISVIVADALWVVGALGVLVGSPDSISAWGSTALGAVTVVVGVLAIFQFVGLREGTRSR